MSSDLKLAGDGSFERAVAERRQIALYRDRRVSVTTRITPEGATFVIADEGPGFDVSAIPDPTEPANLERPSGRGVLFMRIFMDDVRYTPTGNQVTLVKRRGSRAECVPMGSVEPGACDAGAPSDDSSVLDVAQVVV